MRLAQLLVTILSSIFHSSLIVESSKEEKLWFVKEESPTWLENSKPSCTGKNRIILPENDAIQIDPRLLDISSEIIFPRRNGLLWFEEYSNISMNDLCDPNEKDGKVIKISPRASHDWINPLNWKSSEYVPHLERLPCTYDKATLKGPLKIAFPSKPIKVGRISIDDEEFTTSSSFRYFVNHSSSFLFHTRPSHDSVITGATSCPNESGCLCGTKDFKDEICYELECEYNCSSGLKPTNHCCYNICGAIIHLTTYENGKIIMSELERIIRTNYFDISAKVEYHISKVSNEDYEIIFMEVGNGTIENAHKSAERVERALKQNYKDDSAYYIWTETSGTGPTASKAQKTFGGFLGIGIVGLLSFGAYKVYRNPENPVRTRAISYGESAADTIRGWRRGRERNEAFARFDNPDVEMRENREMEVEIPPDKREAEPPLQNLSFRELRKSDFVKDSGGFDNVLYEENEEPAQEEGKVEEDGMYQIDLNSTSDNEISKGNEGISDSPGRRKDETKEGSGMDNPAYSAHEDDEDKIRDRLGIDNPTYMINEKDEGGAQDEEIRDRIGIDNPVYEAQEREEDETGTKLGIENPVYGEDFPEGERNIEEKGGIDNPLYGTNISEDESKKEKKSGIDNPLYLES